MSPRFKFSQWRSFKSAAGVVAFQRPEFFPPGFFSPKTFWHSPSFLRSFAPSLPPSLSTSLVPGVFFQDPLEVRGFVSSREVLKEEEKVLTASLVASESEAKLRLFNPFPARECVQRFRSLPKRAVQTG